jgi:sugar lactone lactonase YvrE
MIRKISMAKVLALGLLLPSVIVSGVACEKEKNPHYVSPVIQSFAPESAAKDSIVIIEGANFSAIVAENNVTINGVATTVLDATPARISVKVPLRAGNGKITVRVGNSTASSATDFTYLYTVTTLAGNGEIGSDDGPDTTAKFFAPFGLTTDADGNIIVADAANNKIRRITPAGIVSTIAGDGTIGTRNGAANMAQFNFPRGVATDKAGNIFVADAGNNLIRKITPAGTVSTIAGDGTDGFADGQGILAKFSFPVDLLVDTAGNIFLTDGNNGRIRKITPQGLVSTLGNVIPGFPEGIEMDGAGNLYIANVATHVIQKMTPQGALETIAGSGIPGLVNGPANLARFLNPEGIAIDADGNLFIGDLSNGVIRKITPAGEVSTFAGSQRGFGNGLASIAKFNEPSGIAIDKSGNIYVADVNNMRIRKIQ